MGFPKNKQNTVSKGGKNMSYIQKVNNKNIGSTLPDEFPSRECKKYEIFKMCEKKDVEKVKKKISQKDCPIPSLIFWG